MYKGESAAHLGEEIHRSMACYLEAHPFVRCCLLIVAIRLGSNKLGLNDLGAAFVDIDTDHDGEISGEELAEALSSHGNWWDNIDLLSNLRTVLMGDRFDATELVAVADLDHSYGLSFTELLAASLYARQGSDESLVHLAFEALDEDRDGFVRVGDVLALLEAQHYAEIPTLPCGGAVCLRDWQVLFDSAFTTFAGLK